MRPGVKVAMTFMMGIVPLGYLSQPPDDTPHDVDPDRCAKVRR